MSDSSHLLIGARRRRQPLEVRTLIVQLLVLVGVVSVAVFLIDTALENLRARGVSSGFAFLKSSVPWPVTHTWLEFVPGVSTYGRALLVGLLNTLTVSAIAIVLSTALGTAIGLSRLSSNWLLSRTAALYVEITRNVPELLQLVFWYQILLHLPAPRNAVALGGAAFLSNRGIHLPSISVDSSLVVAMAVGAAISIFLPRLLKVKYPMQSPSGWLIRIALGLLLPLAVIRFAHVGVSYDWPQLKGLNFRGGLTLTPELSALVIGLTLFTSGFVAEIVRSGIQEVPAGQWEAAKALGLSYATMVRKIVLPQTLRIVVPPLTNEYLGVIKGSSLAVAVGYPDFMALATTTISDTGQAIETFTIVIVGYLTVCLTVSWLMNWYNARVALVTR